MITWIVSSHALRVVLHLHSLVAAPGLATFTDITVQLAVFGLILFALAWAVHEVRIRWGRRPIEKVPYAMVAPDHAPPVVAAEILENVPARSVLPAELIHLAVQRSLQIGRVTKSSAVGKKRANAKVTKQDRDFARYGEHFTLTLRSRHQQHAIEEQLVRELFLPPVTGAECTLTEGKNSELSRSLSWVFQQRRGFLLNQRLQSIRGRGTTLILAAAGMFLYLTGCVLGLITAQNDENRAGTFTLLAAVIIGLVIGVFAVKRFSMAYLTAAGAQMRERLLAVKRFILLDDVEREFLMLERARSIYRRQRREASSEEQTRTQDELPSEDDDPLAFFTPDPLDTLAIYERIMPYAMLFRLRNRWLEVLIDEYYKFGLTPEWISDVTSDHLEQIPVFISSLSNTLQDSVPSVTGGGPANFNSA